MRRALVVALLAFLAVVGGAGSAVAAGTRPAMEMPSMCTDPPTAELVGDSPLDKIDPGPAVATDSTYGRLGYSGWNVFGYDAGCMDKLRSWAGNVLPGDLGTVVKTTTVNDSPAVKLAQFLIQAQLFLIAVITVAVRIVYGDHQVWSVLEPVETMLRTVTGPAALLAWLAVGLSASAVWFLAKADSLRLGESTKRVSISAGVVAAGCFLAVWTGTVAKSTQDITADVYQSASQVASGDANTDAGTAVASTLMDHMTMVGWGQSMLGWDAEAVDTWAPRLRAATSVDREQSAQAKGDPAARERLVKAKGEEFEKVAAELKAADPRAHAMMASKSGWRALGPGLALFGTLLSVIIMGFCIAWVVLARFIVPSGVAAVPVLAPAGQYPGLQRWAVGFGVFLARVAAAAVAATVALTTYIHVFVVNLLAQSSVGVGGRLLGFVFVSASIVAAWKFRGKIAQWSGVDKAVDQAGRIREAVADAMRDSRAQERAEEVVDGAGSSASGSSPASSPPDVAAESGGDAEVDTRQPRTLEGVKDVEPTSAIQARRKVADEQVKVASLPAAHRPPRTLTKPVGDPFTRSTNPALRKLEVMEAAELSRKRELLVAARRPVTTTVAKKAVTTTATVVAPRPVKVALAVPALVGAGPKKG